MAALIRCSRFLPVFRNLSLSRGLIHNAINSTCPLCIPAIHNSIFNKQTYHTRTSTLLQLSPSLEVTRPQALASPAERLLLNIDKDIKRFHRISEIKFKQFICIMDTTAKPLTSLQVKFVLRCTGSLLYDMQPHQRLRLAEEIWTKLEKTGEPPSLMHYNTLLQVYLENRHNFLPAEFLGWMEARGITPNRVTYQHLIAKYCDSGDIQGASQTLEHMKNLDMPITEYIFNSLITGHFKANDEAGALSTMNIMNEAGVVPSHITYGTVALRYAENGKITEMKKIMQDAEIVGATVKPAQLLEIVYTLTTTGQTEHVPEMLSLIKRSGMLSRGDSIKCIHNLIFEGHDDVAYQVFLVMQRPSRLDEDENTFGRFFTRALVKNERPLDKVIELVTDMSEKGYNRDGPISIPQIAYLVEKTEYALKALERMISKGEPVKIHYLWPAICQFRNQQDKDGIYRAVDMMQTLQDQVKTDIGRTVEEFILPSLKALGESAVSAMEELQKHGLPSDIVTFSIFISLLREKGIDPALKYVEGKTMKVSPGVLKSALKDHEYQSKDWESVVQVLAVCNQNILNMNDLININGNILLEVCGKNQQNLEVVEQIIDRFTECNLKIFERHEKRMKSSFEELSDTVWMKLHGLVTTEVGASSVKQMAWVDDLIDMPKENLEKLAAEYPRNLAVKKWLLSKCCSTGDVENAERIMGELDSVGYVYQGFILRQLIMMFAVFKQDLKQSRLYLDKLEDEYPEYENYIQSLLATATLMVQNGSIEDGLERLKKYRERHENFMLRTAISKTYVHFEICLKLAGAASKVGNPVEAMEMVDAIFDLGYVKDGTFSVFEEYVQGFIHKGDITDSLQAFSLVIKKFKRACKVNELFMLCIKQEDSRNLQKVMDLAISIHGEMNIVNQLMCSFLECGQLTKARKVLETPGIRAMMIPLKSACNKFLRYEMVTDMVNLMEVTKDMVDIDREAMLFQLMRLYVKVGDFTKAVDILTCLEKENLQPRMCTLHYLAKVLKSKDLEVPFEIPPMKTSVPVEMEEIQLVADAIKNDISHMIDMKEELDRRDESEQKLLGSQFITNVASSLLGKKRFQDFNSLLVELASRGDVQSLLHMKVQFYDKSMMIGRNLFNAFVNSNRVDEMMEILQENPMAASLYISLDGIRCLKKKFPESLENLKTLACEFADKGQLHAINNMWMYYFLEESEEADVLLQRFPVMLKSLHVAMVCFSAMKDGKEDKLHKVIEIVRDHNENSLTIAYSHLLELHCTNEDADSAVMTLEHMRRDGLRLAAINRRVARYVEQLLEKHNKKMPLGVSDEAIPSSRQGHFDSDASSSNDGHHGK